VKLDEADVPVTSEEEAYPVKLDEADVPVTLEEGAYPVKLDEAEYPVKLDEAEYPVKLDELWFPRVLTGLLASQRFSLWWEGGCLSVILCCHQCLCLTEVMHRASGEVLC